MKNLITLTIVVLFALVAKAQPPAGNANKGDVYGENINTTGATKISKLPNKLTMDDSMNVKVKVKAKVLDVCPKKGCWMKLEVNDTTTALVKMKNYGFFVPLATIGKTVVVDGVAVMKTTSVEELRHIAEEAKKSEAEIAAITEPKTEIQIMANGITVVK